MTVSLRQKSGAFIYDVPRLLCSLRPGGGGRVPPWVLFRNRRERLIHNPNGPGVACDWQYASELDVARAFPAAGRLLLRRALRDFPVVFSAAPRAVREQVDVSFVIGHRGLERLPHLLLTLQTIRSQEDVSHECIVVEQSPTPEIDRALPRWVRYIHSPVADATMPYCRSSTLNIGAKLARGALVVFHDNDLLLPTRYASLAMERLRAGFEVMNLKRFTFYLGEKETRRILAAGSIPVDTEPEMIVQNLEAGGSVAVGRAVFDQIGGFDEDFCGWGGEDNEFWERALTRRVWPFGFLPIVHLWHAPQAEKCAGSRSASPLFTARSAIPARQRIGELRARDYGNVNRFSPRVT